VYTSLAGRTIVVAWLLGITLALDVVAAFSDILELNLLNRAIAGELVSFEEVTSNDTRQTTLGIFQLLLFALTVVAFVSWMYRAHTNLDSLRNNELKYTHGWAIGAWFVPFMNLVRPFQIVREIWNSSTPHGRSDDTPGLLQAWWTMFILSTFIGNFAVRTAFSSETLEDLRNTSLGFLALDVTDGIAAALAIMVVLTISHLQQEKRQQMRP